jgi:hypothetical protein
MSEATAWSAAAFLLGAITTAIARASVERFWGKARPAAKISGIQIAPTPASQDTEIAIPFELRRRAETSPFPGLKPLLTARELSDYLRDARPALDSHKELVSIVDEMASRPNPLPALATPDEQRASLIAEWIKGGNSLENLARNALKVFDREIPAVLRQPHPPEWKDPQRCRIYINQGAGSGYDLSETDVDDYVARAEAITGPSHSASLRADIEAANIINRLWIRLNADEIRWFLTRVRDYGNMVAGESEQLIDKLSALRNMSTPDYLRVQALVSNDGTRAYAIRPLAILNLLGIAETPATSVGVPLTLESAEGRDGEAVVVKGGDATHLMFRSKTTIQEMSSTAPAQVTGERLVALFNARSTYCQLEFTLTGFNLSDDGPLQSDEVILGIL